MMFASRSGENAQLIIDFDFESSKADNPRQFDAHHNENCVELNELVYFPTPNNDRCICHEPWKWIRQAKC